MVNPRRQLLSEILTQLDSLPPLDAARQQVCNLALQNIDDVDVDELTAAIERCPSITTKIIGLANSAFYGAGDSVTSVEEASIRVLGLTMIKNMVLGLSLAESFDASKCSLFDPKNYWVTAFLTGSLNRELCRLNPRETQPDTGYLVGLLFSVGEQALAQCLPEDYNAVLSGLNNAPGLGPIDRYDAEMTEFGMHSGHVGAILAEKWGLPAEVEITMTEHMNPDYSGDAWRYAVLTGVTSRWVNGYIDSINQDYVFEHDALMRLNIEDSEFEIAAGKCFDSSDEARQLSQRFVT